MKVRVYSRPGCGVCNALKAYLRSQQVRFHDADVSRNPEALQEMVNLTGGATTVPVVAVGDEAVIGFNKARLDELLGAQG